MERMYTMPSLALMAVYMEGKRSYRALYRGYVSAILELGIRNVWTMTGLRRAV